LLADGPRTASEIHAYFPIAAPAVSRHLRVLREAGMVSTRRPENDRRVRRYALEGEPLEEVSGWLEELRGGWQRQLESFKDYVEVRASQSDVPR
jgi:DNA-binding transcriptional ArsR family regulator